MNMAAVTHRPAIGCGNINTDDMRPADKALMAVFLVYPLFRNLLGGYDVVWFASMAAAACLIMHNASLRVVITLPMIAWSLLAAVSLGSFLVLGAGATGSPKRCITFAVVVALMLSLASNRRWIRPSMRIVLAMLAVHAMSTLLFFVIPSLYLGIVKPLFFAGDADAIGYQSGLTSHYSYNGMLLSAGTLLAFAEVYANRAVGMDNRAHERRIVSEKRIWPIVLLILFVVALLATTKRAPLVATICAVLLSVYVGSGRYKLNALMKIFAAAVLTVVAFIMLSQFVPQIADVFARFSEIASDDEAVATNGRNYLWDRAIELWQTSPIFGHGWWTYRYYWAGRLDVATSTAHSVPLNLLAEVGVLGLLVYFVAALPPFFGLWKCMRGVGGGESHQRATICFAFSYQVFYLVYCFFGSPLYDVEGYLFFTVLSCGVWFALRQKELAAMRGVASPSGRTARVRVMHTGGSAAKPMLGDEING